MSIRYTNPAQPVVKFTTIVCTQIMLCPSPFAVSTVDIDGTAYAIVASRADSRIIIFNITNPMNLTSSVSFRMMVKLYPWRHIFTYYSNKDGMVPTYILTAARDVATALES